MLRRKIRNLQAVKSRSAPSMNLKSDPSAKSSNWKYINEKPAGVENLTPSNYDRETPSVGPQMNYKMDSAELEQFQSSGTGTTPKLEDSIEIKQELNPAFSKPDFNIK